MQESNQPPSFQRVEGPPLGYTLVLETKRKVYLQLDWNEEHINYVKIYPFVNNVWTHIIKNHLNFVR